MSGIDPDRSMEDHLRWLHMNPSAPPVYPYLEDRIIDHAYSAPVYMPRPYAYKGIWIKWWSGQFNTIPKPHFEDESFDLDLEDAFLL